MSRKIPSTLSEIQEFALSAHIRELGLSTVDQYREWCVANGFSRKLKKHPRQFREEQTHARQAIVRDRLQQMKREKRNVVEVLTQICEGKLSDNDVSERHLKTLCQILRSKPSARNERGINRKSLVRLLIHLKQCRAKFFDDAPVIAQRGNLPGNTYVEALALVATHFRSWLRPIEVWKPQSYSARRQFASLVRHLFVQYDMPSFFDSVWFSGFTSSDAEQRNWYLHVGRGQNIRNCQLPIALTKKMAHHFMHAPDDVSFQQALRWGQVLGLGGDVRLARAILGTRLNDHFDHDEFWSTVIRWFALHPLLDRVQVGPIIDYLHHQRFVPEQLGGERHREAAALPPQPNLSMKGRTPESLLRKVDEWHRTLAKDNRQQIREWAPCGINGFELFEGSPKCHNGKYWTIRELLSSKALIAEGRRMRHCVATYASSCAQGHCSIWTLEVQTSEGLEKVLTVEVRNSARQIVQARGKANRSPTEKEKGILRRWTEKAGLSLANYI